MYPDSEIRCEYVPLFDLNMHIDILVIKNKRWIPIELKYKTKACEIKVNQEIFYLKNHGAKDVNCYRYLADIQRIEKIRDKEKQFEEGYSVFLTNDQSYTKVPQKENCVYKEFSIEEGAEKRGTLAWSPDTGDGTKKGMEDPITLKDCYEMRWKEYCVLNESNTGKFLYVVNKISRI